MGKIFCAMKILRFLGGKVRMAIPDYAPEV